MAVLGYIGKEIYRVYWGDIEEEIEELQEEVQDRMQDIRGRIDTVLHVNEIKGRWQRAISRARGERGAERLTRAMPALQCWELAVGTKV